MKNSLMITLKRRMIWRGNKTVIEVKRAAGSQQLDQGQTWLKKQKRRESEYVVEDEILKGRQEVRKKGFFCQLYTDKCITAVTT